MGLLQSHQKPLDPQGQCAKMLASLCKPISLCQECLDRWSLQTGKSAGTIGAALPKFEAKEKDKPLSLALRIALHLQCPEDQSLFGEVAAKVVSAVLPLSVDSHSISSGLVGQFYIKRGNIQTELLTKQDLLEMCSQSSCRRSKLRPGDASKTT